MVTLENYLEIEANILHKKCLVLAIYQYIDLNFGTILLSKHKTVSDFYAISYDQKSMLSYLSISTLSTSEVLLFVSYYY